MQTRQLKQTKLTMERHRVVDFLLLSLTGRGSVNTLGGMMGKEDALGKEEKFEGGRVERPAPYDPLDYTNLAANVVSALIGEAIGPLPPSARLLESAESPENITTDLLRRGAL